MTDVSLADDATREAILALEERRRQALIDLDIATLDDVYDDALIHIHAPGLVHTKAQLLEHAQTRNPYIDMWREDLLMRAIGDVVIVTGRLVNRLRNPDGGERTVSGQVTQVARRCDDGAWRFVTFQMTPDGEQVWGALKSGSDASQASASAPTQPQEN
ncbi:nuclear transport factor 2 family protein [Demequina sp. NBRC 110056]|uniref:nuclear transport factor 2 family protein n=1 Tax=Demequina sp. NBRC 110056 TaxID=1570345 RepID=UPI000A01DA54|nr:nuclear transport factor 2 family protein [Demequina sp. NBRC 110056]